MNKQYKNPKVVSTLKNRVKISVFWNLVQRLGVNGIGLLVTLVLAKLLAPADYGVMAMMAMFLAIANSLMDSGFTQALIRKPNATDLDYNTAFYSNLALGLFAYVLLYSSAVFIADFYNDSRLIDLIRISGLTVLINSTKVVHVAILSRELNFKAQLQATVPASIVSGTASIILAYIGYGVWSLIIQMLIAAFLTSIAFWLSNTWRPAYSFSLASLKEMYSFGSRIFLVGLLESIYQNMYGTMIARLFTASIAGHYYMANKIKEIILAQVVGSIQAVTYPAMASIQNDTSRMKEGYRQIIKVTTFILFPMMLALAALSHSLVLIVLHDKWLPIVPMLQLLCIASLLYPVNAINLNILKVIGRSDLLLYLSLFRKLLCVAVMVITYRHGVMGILIGQIVCSVLAYIPNSYFTSTLIGYTVQEQIKDVRTTLFLSVVIGIATYLGILLIEWSQLVELIVFGAFFLALYLGGSYLLKLPALDICISLIKYRSKRKE